MQEAPTLSPAVVEALAIGSLPEIQWKPQDDLCDCTYQRIGLWTNPYLAETLEVRMCCIWAELYKQFPEFVRTVPAFYDYNADEWVTEPMEWNGEDEMPKAIWYRHLARKHGRAVAEIRAEFSGRDSERPKGAPVKGPAPFFLPFGGEWLEVDFRNWVAE